jgi:hypothetical protein
MGVARRNGIVELGQIALLRHGRSPILWRILLIVGQARGRGVRKPALITGVRLIIGKHPMNRVGLVGVGWTQVPSVQLVRMATVDMAWSKIDLVIGIVGWSRRGGVVFGLYGRWRAGLRRELALAAPRPDLPVQARRSIVHDARPRPPLRALYGSKSDVVEAHWRT